MNIKVKLPDYVCKNNGLTEHEYHLLEVRDRRIEKFYYDGWREGGYYHVSSVMSGVVSIMMLISGEERKILLKNLGRHTDYSLDEIVRQFRVRDALSKEARKRAIRMQINKLNEKLKSL